MTYIPEGLKYTNTHEWIETRSGDTVRVGITDERRKQLGYIIFVLEATVGDRLEAGEPVTTIESVELILPVHAPGAGQVTAFNDRLTQDPEVLNDDPYGAWVFEMSLRGPSSNGLLSAKGYADLLAAWKEAETG